MDAVWTLVEKFGVAFMAGTVGIMLAMTGFIIAARLTHHRSAANKLAKIAYAATWTFRFSGHGHRR